MISKIIVIWTGPGDMAFLSFWLYALLCCVCIISRQGCKHAVQIMQINALSQRRINSCRSTFISQDSRNKQGPWSRPRQTGSAARRRAWPANDVSFDPLPMNSIHVSYARYLTQRCWSSSDPDCLTLHRQRQTGCALSSR